MITVEALNRTYGTLHAVKNVSFSIDQGEIIGLLGPNGASKTTIMKMMCGFLEPSAGKVTINGLDVASQTKSAQALIGYLPENLPVYPEMTVVAYLEYAAHLRGIDKAQVGVEIKRVIEATDLHAKALDKINSLSRGLKQRVGVAQALLGNPKVLVLDEPTNGLDPTQTLHMRELIKRLAETATVILSTHILSEVEAVCDRVIMVKNGELVLNEKLSELHQSSAIEVHTSLSEQALRDALRLVKGLEITTEAAAVGCHARIATEAADINAVSAAIARAIIAMGGELYQLRFEQRDLESLFRELNAAGGVAHAA